MTSPPHAMKSPSPVCFCSGARGRSSATDSEDERAAAAKSATATAVRVVPTWRIAARFAAHACGSFYQAWSTPQCGQPTEVVTAALKTKPQPQE